MRAFACDALLIENEKLLLIRRAAEPFKGKWALPGGMIGADETAEDCLKREMKEETALEIELVQLVGVYSDPERDPRGTISAAYLVKRISGEPKAGDDAGEAEWFGLDDLPELCFDHSKIVVDALTLRSQ